MTRLFAVALSLVLVSSAAFADSTITFTFEGQAPGLAPGPILLSGASADGILNVTLERAKLFGSPATGPFGFADLTPFGIPGFGMSLDPFFDTSNTAPFLFNIDDSGLLPGIGVSRVEWTMGDFGEDQDRVTVQTLTTAFDPVLMNFDAFVTEQSATIGNDPLTFLTPFGPFDIASPDSSFAERSTDFIRQLTIISGGDTHPSSIYIGEITFFLTASLGGGDLPDSSGGGTPPGAGANSGAAPAIPEPFGLGLLGLGLAAIALRRRR